MRIHGLRGLRNQFHILLLVPLVVIVMTWPSFARIFDSGEFWLHVQHRDSWLNFWNAWHVERVLAGQTDFFYSDFIFHPQGLSLAFKHIVVPHALLFLALQKLMPADDAYTLLYLLMLCFNALCAYMLIQHLVKDKWIALFGAVAAGVNPYVLQGSTTPDLILFGTLPLTMYCVIRAVNESRLVFAALAGAVAGITAFISMYIFVYILLTFGIYAIYLTATRWRQPAFWRQMLLFAGLCGAISLFRIYPMVCRRRAPRRRLGVISRSHAEQRCIGLFRPYRQYIHLRSLARLIE